MNQIRAYISHSIRGKMGEDATDEYIKANNSKAIEFGAVLKKLFPGIDFYVPGDHDEFVMIAYKMGYLSSEKILDVDCVIVNNCDFLIAYSPDGFISGGMQVEINYANTHNIPVFVIDSITTEGLGAIHQHLERLKT